MTSDTEIPKGRVLAVRIILGLFALVYGGFGLVGLLVPEEAAKMLNEPFTPGLWVVAKEQGAASVSWAVAFALAALNPIRNVGLVRATIVTIVLFSLVQFQVTAKYGHTWSTSATMNYVLNGVFIVLATAVAWLYPWKAARSPDRPG
jgi:hypothetical protein